eukprot:5572821-Pleurochrysis_carterae.AAC.1
MGIHIVFGQVPQEVPRGPSPSQQFKLKHHQQSRTGTKHDVQQWHAIQQYTNSTKAVEVSCIHYGAPSSNHKAQVPAYS